MLALVLEASSAFADIVFKRGAGGSGGGGSADGLGTNRDVGDATVSGGSGDVLNLNAGVVGASEIAAGALTAADADTDLATQSELDAFNDSVLGYTIMTTSPVDLVTSGDTGDRWFNTTDLTEWRCEVGSTDHWIQVYPTSGGAPTTVNYLVGTADAGLSAEIPVGATPGGELGGSWASPTIDDAISINNPVLTGVHNLTGVAVDDNDCTGDQGKMWWDSASLAFKFCVANNGAIPIVFTTSGTYFPADTMNTTVLTSERRSISWNAQNIVTNGSVIPGSDECAIPAIVTLNSGPLAYTVVCDDDDAASMYVSVNIPDSWISTSSGEFEIKYIQTAANTGALNLDVAAQCRGEAEVVSGTWGTEVDFNDAAVTGSNGVDSITVGLVPVGGCVGGDELWFRIQIDATGTTTTVASLHFISAKYEWISGVGD